MTLGVVDLIILLGYLAGVVALGTWVGRGARNVAEYVLGGRNLPWWLILFSIVATETSTVTFLSIPGFAFSRDLTWLQLPLGFILARFAIGVLLLPRYFQGRYFTAYQVLDERFGGATKQVASVMFIVTRTLADGLRLFLSAIVLQELTGLSLHWAALIVGALTIAYTFFGGMRAVLWTDLAQFVVYMVGAGVAFVLILHRLPEGWDQFVAMGDAAGKLRLFEFSFDWKEPYTFWAGLVGGTFVTLGSHGVDQMMVQRYLCARSLHDARRALWVSGFVVLAQFALFLLIGVGLYAFYQLYPPAVAFERPDRVFARFILDEMPVGLLGLLLGAVFAAAMSTLSSSLNSCATAAVNDLYLTRRRGDVSAAKQLGLIRALTVVFGLAQIAVGIGGQWLADSVVNSVLAVAGFTTGIVLGVFFLGIGAQRVGQTAALAGLVVGLTVMTAIKFLTPLAWPWYPLVGSLTTFSVGWLASWVWPREATTTA